MAKEKICGIYCIENLINGKKYIGQSKNIYHRWDSHKSSLNNRHHFNNYLQKLSLTAADGVKTLPCFPDLQNALAFCNPALQICHRHISLTLRRWFESGYFVPSMKKRTAFFLYALCYRNEQPSVKNSSPNCFLYPPALRPRYLTFVKYYFFKFRHPPAFPCRLQHSIIGRLGLNERVRDGNGCVPQTHRHRKLCYPLDNTTVYPTLTSSSLERR